MKKFLATMVFAASVSALALTANAAEKLTIVTSFPADMTDVIKAAFEKKYKNIKLQIVNKKTSAGIKFIQETASKNTSDMFWASAPDAFEVLKDDGLLAKYSVKAKGIPDKVGTFPVNDKDGFYKGFAAAGYGIMWNERYIKAYNLPVPKEWADLAKPVYHGHIGISAPSRSGTTHLTIEAILQGKGWKDGWATIKALTGNAKTITERSFGVPDGVNSGSFGIGVVIDFFGLSSQASGFPVGFRYPTVTPLVPANIAIVKNAPNPKAASVFIEYLLSPEGQKVLLNPKIMRLPINPKTYADAPKGLPNPFKDTTIGSGVDFSLSKSKGRYNVVNSLFDSMITYRLDELRAATKAIQAAEKAQAGKKNDKAAKLIAEAKELVNALPIDEAKASEPKYASIFKKKRKKATTKVPATQAAEEAKWDAMVVANYKRAVELANKAASM